MRVSASLHSVLLKLTQSVLRSADRLFNKVFTADYNPLYRSGTLAVASLFLATISGVVLLLFYRVGAPYESVFSLSQNYFGSFLRGFHRLTSDATIVFLVIHCARMFAQKKSYGPRTMAWMVGTVLLFLVLITGWSGFVLVWDQQGQAVTLALARILDSMGIFLLPLMSGFDGEVVTPPSSFFFLTTFIHVALPVLLVFLLWVHTMKMARASWIPERKVFVGMTLILTAVALLFPVALLEQGHLLSWQQPERINIFYNFFLYWPDNIWAHSLWIFVPLGVLFFLPVILRPLKSLKPSDLDIKKCQGCKQCVLDCPYEAISMIRRPSGPPISETVAQVNPDLCVSCGLCAASCGPMTIGPQGRKGSDQFQNVKSFVEALGEKHDIKKQTVIIACTHQAGSWQKINQMAKEDAQVEVYPVACMGTLHMATIGQLATRFDRVKLAACHGRNCHNKDAFMLLNDRLKGDREPGLPSRIDLSRVRLYAIGDGEEKTVFRDEGSQKGRLKKQSMALFGGFLAAGLILIGSQAQGPQNVQHGLLRVATNPLAHKQVCPQEETLRPSALEHMQMQLCQTEPITYLIEIKVDDEKIFSESISARKRQSLLYFQKDFELDPGRYPIEVSLQTLNDDQPVRMFSQNVIIAEQEIALIKFSHSNESIFLYER